MRFIQLAYVFSDLKSRANWREEGRKKRFLLVDKSRITARFNLRSRKEKIWREQATLIREKGTKKSIKIRSKIDHVLRSN